MGKRKRNVQGIVKVNVSAFVFGEGRALPVVVQHSSNDSRRVERTVRQIPTPRQNTLPPAFNPSPSFEDAQDHAFGDASEPMDEQNGPEHVSLRFSLYRTCSNV